MFSSDTTQVSDGGYQISRSLRFNSADTTYLNRTPASAGNRRTWTWSGWVKRSTLNASGSQSLFDVQLDAPNFFTFYIRNDTVAYDMCHTTSGNRIVVGTTAVYRDVSAWYHFVLAVDTTNATAANRIRAYVNGSEVILNQYALGSGYVAQNADLAINSTSIHSMGRRNDSGGDLYLPAYMTEVNFIDGSQLTPSSFGETNAQTGVWQPKAYSGSYGTNGFYLNFSDNSNTTAATLGKDYSGNGNNWTPNNFSVTAGAGNDSLVDSPTSYGTDTGVGGTVRGNYCTLNPLQNGMTNAPRNGNLEIAGSADIYRSLFGTFGVSSGKWYFEVVITSGSGVTNVAWSSTSSIYQYAGEASTSYGYELENGNKINNGGTSAYGSALTTNDVFMCAVDMDNLKLFFGKNGTWFNSSNPATGTSPAYTFAAGTYFFQMRPYTGSSSVVTTNFGQRAFAYTAPSGFKALCTQNLPTPTIGATTATQAGKYFNTVTFTSPNGGAVVTGVGFQPDFTWEKGRSVAESNALFNVLQGNSAFLISNSTAAEGSFTNVWVPSSDGFTIPAGVLSSGQTYVSWNWKANGSGSTNTSGSITSTVSANTTSGFSVVTYTGVGGTSTVGHGLGVAPAMIIIKERSPNTDNWNVYHQSLGNQYWLQLNTASAQQGPSSDMWNNTSPTSTVMTVRNPGSGGYSNRSGANYVAYCFAEVAGFSKIGSWVGNGSTDGPFVYCGFRPAFLLVKNTATGTQYWDLYDNKRNTYNPENLRLFPNATDGDNSSTQYDFLSNGFKVRSSDFSSNESGKTFIFIAFAEVPLKFSLAR